MPREDQVRLLATAAQYATDRGYHVIAAAPGMVALRMVLDGHADVVISPTAIDLPEVQIADQAPPPLIPRPRTAPDVVPPSRRRPRRRIPDATRDAPGGH